MSTSSCSVVLQRVFPDGVIETSTPEQAQGHFPHAPKAAPPPDDGGRPGSRRTSARRMTLAYAEAFRAFGARYLRVLALRCS
jgi:hypothetical protein